MPIEHNNANQHSSLDTHRKMSWHAWSISVRHVYIFQRWALL